MSGRTLRYILIGGLVLAIGVPSVAMGFGEGRALILGKRNPSGHRTLTKETQIIGNVSTYATRQSNKKVGDGGGAIYGCRSNVGNEPCILTRNLRDGRAFQFETAGKEGGRIETGDANGAPFTTNATGVATGLNADRVDGKDGADIANAGDFLSARVTAAGTLSGGRGATAAAIETGPKTYRVTFSRDVSNCTYTATPQGAATSNTLAVQAGSNPQNVRVDADVATPFQLIVVC
jgi:hypothetical protein